MLYNERREKREESAQRAQKEIWTVNNGALHRQLGQWVASFPKRTEKVEIVPLAISPKDVSSYERMRVLMVRALHSAWPVVPPSVRVGGDF